MEGLKYNTVKDNDEKVNTTGLKFYEIVKRLFDIISSTLGLVLFSPLFFILIVVIKLDSRGQVFFSHERVGYKGKTIKVYKFRSMIENAEDVLRNFTPEQKAEFEKNFKLEYDPRITKVGNFLRRTSLDELPQLINIIKGDMSVIGPRPIIKKEIDKYGDYATKLFSIKPGLTGYWQANGRSYTTYEERVNMDMYYIDNRCMALDVKILLKTIISVIKKEGAV